MSDVFNVKQKMILKRYEKEHDDIGNADGGMSCIGTNAYPVLPYGIPTISSTRFDYKH